MLRHIRLFAAARDGLAAVEFALIAPVMIAMFYGAVELSSAVDCNSRVAHVASTTSDLVAQSTTVSTTDIDNIFQAANAILYPYSSTGAQIVVSSLVDDGHGGATVAWSDAQNTSPLTVGSTVSVPSGLIVSGSGGSVILSTITYVYNPPVTHFLGGAVTLTSSFYSRPRRSLTVTHS